MRLISALYHKYNKAFLQKWLGREETKLNSQSPHLSPRAGRSAGTSLGSDASSGLHQQIYITRAQTALHQLENIMSYEISSQRCVMKKKERRNLTWNSRWSLDIFSIEMLDDGFTFLCWLHPTGKGKCLLKAISVFNSKCILQCWRFYTCTGHQRSHSPWLILNKYWRL